MFNRHGEILNTLAKSFNMREEIAIHRRSRPMTERKQDPPSQTTCCRQRTFFPALGPHLGSERHANNNARIPPCEDGVGPFATTASAANDKTTTNEDGRLTGMANDSDNGYLDREVCANWE